MFMNPAAGLTLDEPVQCAIDRGTSDALVRLRAAAALRAASVAYESRCRVGSVTRTAKLSGGVAAPERAF